MIKLALTILVLINSLSLMGEDFAMHKNDSTEIVIVKRDPKLFYDSLQMRASRHRITKWLYGSMISAAKDTANKGLQSYEYYKIYKNKTIGSITIRSLEVFGPSFNDTARTTNIWVEKMANKLHSKSNLYVIRKNLWIKEGQLLDPNLLMDNENLLRSLPYLKDVRILINTRPFNNDVVDITILTQDVFSFGVSGGTGDIHNGTLGLYDKNIFGIGHEAGSNIVVNTNITPYIGFESFYAINNILGKFINFSSSYSNTYIHQEAFVSLNSDFLRPQSVYAGGLTALRSFRTNRIYSNDNVLSPVPLNYVYLDGWYGRNLKLGINANDSRFQMTLSGRIRYTSFYERPLPDINNNQYFANSTFFLGGLSFSKRTYVRDFLVYSYGITEDIPKGYLHEFVFGFDHNEFGDRWYSHLFFSTGNLFKNKPYYLYTSIGAGSFFKRSGLDQGIVDFKLNFISQLFEVWNVKARQFIKMNYTLGINRFEIEELLLRNSDGIRGFGSNIGKGQQRLTLNVENVFFQKKSILNFQSALFSFFDVGIVGPEDQSIFRQNYYAGIGVGLRIRNENLIFKTIQLRLAFYPNHPNDISSFGFMLDGVSKTTFYNFQPHGPEPLRFE
jgi:hypothetical protein